MAADGRFGGHIVSGHIDGTGTITALRPGRQRRVVHGLRPPALLRYIVEKGSIAIDGISLTVAAVEADRLFRLRHPPHGGGDHPGAKAAGGHGQPGDGHHRQICGEAAAARGRNRPQAASPWNF